MKRAADTNVIVRLITQDDARQLEKAMAFVAEGVVHVPPTVLLEVEWVLRSAFSYRPGRVLNSLAALLALPNIEVANEDHVAEAMRLHDAGMDFADALHLTFADRCSEFATFDRGFAERAADLSVHVPVRLL